MVWLQGRLCSSVDITEGLTGSGLPRLLATIQAVCEQTATTSATTAAAAATSSDGQPNQQLQLLDAAAGHMQHERHLLTENTTVSTLLLLALFIGTLAFLIAFPIPD